MSDVRSRLRGTGEGEAGSDQNWLEMAHMRISGKQCGVENRMVPTFMCKKTYDFEIGENEVHVQNITIIVPETSLFFVEDEKSTHVVRPY